MKRASLPLLHESQCVASPDGGPKRTLDEGLGEEWPLHVERFMIKVLRSHECASFLYLAEFIHSGQAYRKTLVRVRRHRRYPFEHLRSSRVCEAEARSAPMLGFASRSPKRWRLC
jgi:hypothetical protein